MRHKDGPTVSAAGRTNIAVMLAWSCTQYNTHTHTRKSAITTHAKLVNATHTSVRALNTTPYIDDRGSVLGFLRHFRQALTSVSRPSSNAAPRCALAEAIQHQAI